MLQTLQELERKGIPGRILTTDYNNFTDPKALDKLAGFKNIELRMYQVQGGEKIGFHTKGYIFKKDETYTFIIGSANMTDRALAVNKEWNTKLVSTEEGEMYKNITAEFNKLWSDSDHTRSYDEFIEEYRIRYEAIKKQKKIALEYAKKNAEDNADSGAQILSLEQYKLSPNMMQIGFINNLKTL
jgi:HKD family nuclease